MPLIRSLAATPTSPRHRWIVALQMLTIPVSVLAQEKPPASGALRESEPTTAVLVYGRVAAGLTSRTNQSTNGATTEIANSVLSSSYVGIRGQENLGGGLAAEFRLESGFAVDTGTAGTTIAGRSRLWSRASYVGLSSTDIFGGALSLTAGRQFHAHADRVTQSLDVYNLAGPTPVTTPLGLFGVNRFVSNDTRVDGSLKLRFQNKEGLALGVSKGFDDGTSGRSVAFDIAMSEGGGTDEESDAPGKEKVNRYTVGLYGVKFRAPNVIAATGVRPSHQVYGGGGQFAVDDAGGVRLFLHYAHSLLDATSANRPAQKNQLFTLGVRVQARRNVILKAAYTHDRGQHLSSVLGRDGTKMTWVQSVEYRFSNRTRGYVAAFNNRFTDGYRLDPLNLAAIPRDPAASSTTGFSVGLRHNF